ncbi:MAG: XTP/dITP diphosphatase [Fusobacteriaceae bacterium]
MLKVFLATGNKNKIIEMKDIIESLKLDIELLSINDKIEIPDVVEDGKTFEENSQKKAIEISKFLNMITISDDSGLCVTELNDEPGVYSARFAGENATDKDNNQKLLERLKGISKREAKFVCVITLAKPNGEFFSFRGELRGEILRDSRGKNGFGYDPFFYLKEYEKTLAEIPKIKKEISHRAIALTKLSKEIKKILV